MNQIEIQPGPVSTEANKAITNGEEEGRPKGNTVKVMPLPEGGIPK